MKKIRLAATPAEKLNAVVRRKVARGDQLELIEYTYEKGARFALHAHPAEQLTIVLKGGLVFVQPHAEEITLAEGEALFVPANTPHGAFVPEGIEKTVTYNVFTPVRSDLPTG